MVGKSLALQAMKKLRDGQVLSPEEDKAYRDYYRRYSKLAVKVYFDDAGELERFKKMADADGVAKFSQWLLTKVRLAATGTFTDTRYLEDLQRQAELWRQKYEQERDQAEEYRRENRELGAQNRNLTEKVQEYADEFMRIATVLREETKE